MSLLRKALEGELETPPTTVAEPPTPTPNEGNQPNNTDATVIMSGPLGQVYTQALAVAFAKTEPAEPTPTQQPDVALESQANDAIMAETAFKTVIEEEAEAIENPDALIYGVSAAKVEPSTIVEVATQMSQFEIDQPEEFIVVVDATDMSINPTENTGTEEYLSQPVNDANLAKSELLPVLESMVASMGGRVVYSLKEALECISQLSADEVSTGVEEIPVPETEVHELPTPEPVAEVGSSETVDPGQDPANVDDGTPQDAEVNVEVSLEAEKGGKKKAGEKKAKPYEATSSKLTRAVGMINGVMGNIKETKVRAELHHAVGVILSAKRDVVNSKSSKVALEAGKE